MSTNPFRKSSSLKGPVGSTALIPSSDPPATTVGPLSVDTKVSNPSQKHVNFASPPAIPISPVSYPPSPESSRLESFSTIPSPRLPLPPPIDYSQALSSDPFAAEPSDGEDDNVIEQALENAKVNNEITSVGPYGSNSSKDDAVRDTLGRFASAPRRPANAQSASGAKDVSGPSKPAMDVDAFKRMLLTGDRGSSSSRETVVQQNTSAGPIPVSDSGSSADTASISQTSIFEAAPPPNEDSPRTSDELDHVEASEHRANLGVASEARKKPPPPKSRRGKPLKDPLNTTTATAEPGPSAKFDNFIHSLSLPASRNVTSETPSQQSPPPTEENPIDNRSTTSTASIPEAQKRVPPALPLARKKSQHNPPAKPILTRSSSSRHSVLSEYDGPISPPLSNPTSISTSTSASRPPPPPPSRRATSSADGRPSLDVLSVSEDASFLTPDSRPTLPHTPSYAKRISQGSTPPPVPPPRRGRGSSRSSIETTRPSMAALGIAPPDLSGGPGPGGAESAAAMPRGSFEPRDILADLAALQKEVDAARAGAGQ